MTLHPTRKPIYYDRNSHREERVTAEGRTYRMYQAIRMSVE